jgi:hypothetical protein
MKKSLIFCLLTVALFLGSTSLFAQADFTIRTQGIVVPEGKLDLPNAADLTPEELKAALESGCKAAPDKAPTFCVAYTGVNCTGTAVVIPCGFLVNGTFPSFQLGCGTTYCRLSTDGLLYAFPVGPAPPKFPDNLCINAPAGAFCTQVACTTP